MKGYILEYLDSHGFDVYSDEKETTVSPYGARIRQLREEKSWSQQELANRAGIRHPNLARIETAKYGSSLDILSKIGQALRKEIDFV